ncbi:thiamine pyrophosphate-binding protein [Streptomyces sp. NPDC047079]|uniref:thiamine pyrophosphate-binding protein n=1 Tax=Streptomyces sp. NPDC047079 TaxID=3154607 RepID=UPI0033FA7090
MPNVSDFVAARLGAWGVDRVFGYPGREVDALITALGGREAGPEFLQVRHEESAALMAGAHAKLTGRPGCCLVPSGAGVLRLLGGLSDAALDHEPVVAVVGQEGPVPDADRRRRTVSATRLCAEVSEFCELVTDAEVVGDALDRAFRAALTDRGVATLVLSRRLLETQARPGLADDGGPPSARTDFTPPVRRPEERALHRAAEVLNEGRRVAVVLGRDGTAASGQAVGVAELLGAGVAKTSLACAALPDDLPYATGVIGPFGSELAAALLRECDTLLLVGAGDLDIDRVWHRASSRVVIVDTDPGNRPPGARPDGPVRVTGDAVTALQALLPLLRRTSDRGWREDIEHAVAEWRAAGRGKARRVFGNTVNPRSVVAELSARLPDRAVIVADSGTALDWWTRHLELRNGMSAVVPGHPALPGASVPYAVAARLAYPGRPVIALIGDGAFQGSGLNELITVRRLGPRLGGLPPLVFCVFNNQDLGRLTWQRRCEAGDPLLPASQDVPDVSYAAYARLLGLNGVRCERPAAVGAVWDEALRREGPTLLEFVVDGEEPPDWAEAAGAQRGQGRSLPRISRGVLRRKAHAAVGDLFRSS